MLVIEALKYRNRKDFEKGSRAAFRVAKRHGLLTQICSHMDDVLTVWTTPMLVAEALKYTNATDFAKNSWSAYVIAQKRGLLEQICSHMNRAYLEWTDEALGIEARKYIKIKDFRKYSRKAYNVAVKRGILEIICKHMEDDVIHWTVEMIRIEANKYLFRNEFKRFSRKAYDAARVRGILNEVCVHMRPACNSSACENELFDSIKSVWPNAIKLRDRKVKIENKPYIQGFDLDIFIPELNRAIEFDGIYWHSFEGLKRSRKSWPDEDLHNYHPLKDDWFAQKGIQTLHIKEEDWYRNKNECIEKCLTFLSQE